MPNRILKESICTSDNLDQVDWFGEVLFYRLIVSCDDYGRFDGRIAVIKNRLFPLKENLTLKTVEQALQRLARAGLIVCYTVGGRPYLYLPTWNRHQSIRAKKSKYPDPEPGGMQVQTDASNCSRNLIQSESISESNPKREKPGGFTPPSVEEVRSYCQERRNAVSPEVFVNYYASNGWKVGSTPMKDWKACVRTWENREQKSAVPSAIGKASESETVAAQQDAIRRMQAILQEQPTFS
jgi:hypothetical protein